MLSARAIQPWKVLEMDLRSWGVRSLANSEYLVLVVDEASLFLFAFPLSSNQVNGVGRQLPRLCLTFEALIAVRPDRGQELTADVIQALCIRLRAKTQYPPLITPKLKCL